MNLIERYGPYSAIFVIGCMLEETPRLSRLNGAMAGIIAAVGFVASKTFIEQYVTNAPLISWPLSLTISFNLTYKILKQFKLFRNSQLKTAKEKRVASIVSIASMNLLSRLLVGAALAGVVRGVRLTANSRLFTIASK
jgi:hypothetical protein